MTPEYQERCDGVGVLYEGHGADLSEQVAIPCPGCPDCTDGAYDVEPAPEPAPEDQLALLRRQAVVLRDAAKASPFPLVAGMLNGRAAEYEKAATVWKLATIDDGIGEGDLQLTTRGALEIGCRIYSREDGPSRLMRSTPTGLEVETDDGPRWLNVIGPSSPVIVVA